MIALTVVLQVVILPHVRLAGRVPRHLMGIPITTIGEITRQKRIGLVGANGRRNPLHASGWDSFRE